MTKKDLYREYLVTMNKVHELKGETNEMLNVEENMRYFNPNRESKEDIERMYKAALYRYDEQVRKLRVDAYFATEDGKKLKENAEREKKNLAKERERYINKTRMQINGMIKLWLGEEWEVRSFGNPGYMTICMVDSEGKEIFGHSFNVYSADSFDSNKNRFQMNYGCMGSFDLEEENSTRTRLLEGMAKFATNKENLAELKNVLNRYADKMMVLLDKFTELNTFLNNPFEKEKDVA